jgi:hypothetical protein
MAATHLPFVMNVMMVFWYFDESSQSSQRSLAPPLQLWNVETPRVANNDLHVAAP